MADEKIEKVYHDQESIQPEDQKDELTDQELGKASGGTFEKWIEINKV